MKNILDTHIEAYQGNNLYDFDNEIVLKWYAERIIKFTKNTKSLLELGLGYGYTTSIFSKQIPNHIVLEGSSAVIRNFKRNFSDCKTKIIKTYFESFESKKKFEIIVMGFILEHVENPISILKHFKKFLTNRGKLFVAVPNAEVLNRRLGNAMGILPDIHLLSEHDQLLGHKRYYTVKTLTNDVQEAGFVVVRIEGIYLKPLTTEQMLSLNLDEGVIDALCKVGVNYPELCCGIFAELKASKSK